MDHYWDLPYFYVISGVMNSAKARHRELHENEIPIAVLACQQAEINRDRKKNKKAYTLSDFYCYPDKDEVDSIDGIYGAAALQMIELREFPSWGLFIYKDLVKNASKAKAPSVLGYIGTNVLILAPRIQDRTCVGLLIATEQASNKVVTLRKVSQPGVGTDNYEETIKIRMTTVNGKTVAIENYSLDIVS